MKTTIQKNMIEKLRFNKENFSDNEFELLKDYTLINFIPCKKKLIIKEISLPELKTTNGIYMVENLRKDSPVERKKNNAMVVSVSPDCIFWQNKNGDSLPGISIKPGDFIVYSISSSTEIIIDGQLFTLIGEFDVCGKLSLSDEQIQSVLSTDDPVFNLRHTMIDTKLKLKEDDED